MKVLVFEWMVGGGLLHANSPAVGMSDSDESFLKQGAAMFSAVTEDLIAAGHRVIAPLDPRIVELNLIEPRLSSSKQLEAIHVTTGLPQTLQTLASAADLIFLIAPECDQILADCYRWLMDEQDKWFGGPLPWIEMASDKNIMQSYLSSKGIAVPSQEIEPGQPWVAKPIDGAGCEGVQIFRSDDLLEKFRSQKQWRIEQFVAGESVSVSVIAVDDQIFFLPPTGQVFAAADGPAQGVYLQTQYPIEESLAARADSLSRQTVETLPKFSGYIGIDMVLAETGADVVVEINPRMTMSYCNLPLNKRRDWTKHLRSK